MKKFLPMLVGLVLLAVAVGWGWLGGERSPNFLSQTESGDALLAVFEGVTPCEAQPQPLPQIAGAPCEHVVWALALYGDANGAPASYTLQARYGLARQGTPTGHVEGGTSLEVEGNWTLENENEATVYVLEMEGFAPLRFVQVSPDLLHLLDTEGEMAVGTAGWTFTLSRTQPEQVGGQPLARVAALDAVQPGVFVGRTACLQPAEQLNLSVNTDCQRIKWEITLHYDAIAQTPDGYSIRRVEVNERTEHNIGLLEGEWQAVQGPAGIVLLQLDLAELGSTLLLAQVDANHLFFLNEDAYPLVGDGVLAYTLSRSEE